MNEQVLTRIEEPQADLPAEYLVEWTLRSGEVIQGAGRFPTLEAAELNVMLAFRNRNNWSTEYRIIQKESNE